MKKPFVSAIVPAAGSARRMEGLEKLFEELDGVPVLARTLWALSHSEWIQEMVIITRPDLMVSVTELLRAFSIDKVKAVVLGGATRQASVAAGIAAASPEAQYYAIHDGARPFVGQQVIANTIIDAVRYGVAAAAIPVTDTVKSVDSKGFVQHTPDRSSLYAMQTPQVLSADIYRRGLAYCTEQGLDLTDDCQLAEAIGAQVYLSKGTPENIKITRPWDLTMGEMLLKRG